MGLDVETFLRISGLRRILEQRNYLNPDDAVPTVLYHYTSSAGFEGILREHELRATNYSFLNDPTEVTYGRSIVDAALTVEGQNPAENGLLDRIAANVDIDTLSEIYVFSCTELPDDLAQWRAYGGAGLERYCIGVDTDALFHIAHDTQKSALDRVVYHRDSQIARVREALQRTVRFCRDNNIADHERESCAVTAAEFISRLLPFLKNPAYRQEAEWRLVRWVNHGTGQPRFDTARGVLRPYLSFTLGEVLPINSVSVLAPARREAALKASTMILASAGLPHVVPTHSEVPFVD
ncbi:MAG TPA: DUF2971 domain-containing protein [Thermoanaerobaculia bacterium]|jgi:hypothetical protein|nr:DUF2971 domain-containing protein [Thermoanaerobaculia bacterium]